MLNEKLKKMKSEDKKTVSLLLGFVIVLSCLFVLFEWSSEKIVVHTIDFDGFAEEVVFIPQTPPQRPPAPLPPPPKVTEVIEPTVVNLVPVDKAGTETPNIPSTDPNIDVPFLGTMTFVPIVDSIVTVDFLPYEDMPVFSENIMEFLARNIRYPVVDQQAGISGRVIVQFVVDVDGSITDIQIVRGVSPTIDREARRVVGLMQNWTPGHQRGTPVRVRYTLPIVFRLE